MNKFVTLLAVVFVGLVLVSPGFAKIGVGVGTGKIQIDQPLRPGLIYTLPPLSVVNTGDEPGEYGVSIEYHKGQEKREDMGLKPAKEWFKFEPESFHLEPGESRQVQIKLHLPVRGVKPGNYFAYLEASPIRRTETGQTTIGVAAATKLYFTVAPANIFQGMYYRFISWYLSYHPWATIVLALIFLAIVFQFVSKRFKIQIVRKPQ